MKTSFHRKVSPLERIFVLLSEMDTPFSNQVVIEGTGTIDKELLKKAVEAACAANPGSRLLFRGYLGWARWVDSGVAAPIRDIDGSGWDATGSEGAPFLSESLPFKSSHSCEVVLLKGTPSRIVFRTLHATMDGRGTLIWIENIFRALRGDSLIVASSTVNDSELVSKLDKPKKWERKSRTCLAPTGARNGDESGKSTWRRVRLPGIYPKVLPQATIAIAKEARKQGPGEVCLNIPVDLRRLTKNSRTTVNLTRRIVLRVPEEATVDAIQNQIILNLKHLSIEPRILNALSYIPLWLIGFFFQRIRKKSVKTGVYFTTGSISNLGKLPISQFHGGGFKADTGFFVPPGTEGKPMFMTLSGSDDSLEVIVAMPETLASEGRLDQFISNVTRELKPHR